MDIKNGQRRISAFLINENELMKSALCNYLDKMGYEKSLDSRQELLEVARGLNNSLPEHDALIFNRVPKAGSEMMWALIDQLQVRCTT